VVDNSVALVGGRNIGDQYFQVDPDTQFADDDVFAAGPIARQLSATLMNSELWAGDPAAALLGRGKPQPAAPAAPDSKFAARLPAANPTPEWSRAPATRLGARLGGQRQSQQKQVVTVSATAGC
jgi:phosphatidylserine/phosphatidylglycerophosphate/cardiolipin synthase-like enzyme